MSAPQLNGRTIVVTGAAGGVGSACVRALRDAGAVAVGVDVRPSETERRIVVDLADPMAVERVVDALAQRPVHGLVNNAAENTTAPTTQVDTRLWDQMFAVNVRAPFLLSEALLPLFTDDASVVNVASVHAFATSEAAVPYAATKGALVALTRALAVDWSARGLGIRVNAVAPAAVDTPMLRGGLARTGSSLDDLAARHPLGRVATADEIARVVLFLLSRDASFVHGTTVVADGGALARLSTETP